MSDGSDEDNDDNYCYFLTRLTASWNLINNFDFSDSLKLVSSSEGYIVNDLCEK